MLFILAAMLFNPADEVAIVQEELSQKIPGHVWNCQEIGTGNINFIYLADGGDQKVIVKKDLDFARINPEEFPLPVDRLLYEYRAYTFYEKLVPAYVPKIYFFNLDRGMLAMEYLSPHILLRKGLIEGNKYPLLADHLGSFLARTLYFTSRYHLPKEEWQQNIGLFVHNTAMRKIILDLNYTHPFYGAPINKWTSPELDEIVSDIQNDPAIRNIVDALKDQFLGVPEALAHGDLHTGSILVTPTDTRVIDTEFATYAPISFDIGMLLANFAMASLAADAHGTDKAWLAHTTSQTWDVFEKEFRQLWKNQEINIDQKLDEIWVDTLRLMGVEIIRRTIGVAHNADFETIADRKIKAAVERKALRFAKELLLEPKSSFPDSKTLEMRLKTYL
jgi:5-methylthioribose kinase